MQKIRIIGAPLDLGQERRGVDMGPSAVRAAGLNAALKTLGYEVEDAGNIHVKLPEELHYGDVHAKYLKEISDTCREAAHLVYRTLEEGFFPISLGGDQRRYRSSEVAYVSGLSSMTHCIQREAPERDVLGAAAPRPAPVEHEVGRGPRFEGRSVIQCRLGHSPAIARRRRGSPSRGPYASAFPRTVRST